MGTPITSTCARRKLRAGNLVQPFGPQLQGLPFYLVCPQARREEAAVAAVFEWVRALRPLG
jgi:LysR family glycine cleavage system transcriptional activator